MSRAQVIDLTGRLTSAPASQEAALVRRACQGDRDAFREIVETHKAQMWKVAQRVVHDTALAEDVVQEAFIKVYRALPDFRVDARLSTWLHRITFLTAIDFRRQQQSLGKVMVEETEFEYADTRPMARSDNSVNTRQLRDQLERAMNSLSPLEKSVFGLRHLQDFKLKDIAEIVCRSEGTVKNVLFRAIRKLRAELSAADESPQEFKRC